MAFAFIYSFIVPLSLFLVLDMDVTASVINNQRRQSRDSDSSYFQTNYDDVIPSRPTSNDSTSVLNRLVQQRLPPAPDANLFSGYSCENDDQCQNGGRCLQTRYGGKLCNCTSTWFGPQCEFSAASMTLELYLRPIARDSFWRCLNSTGHQANVQAVRIYKKCHNGDTECWLDEGGANGIKVFYWCLNTGYRMLLTEGQPGIRSRMELYSQVFLKLARRDPNNEESPRGSPRPVYSRLDEEVINESDFFDFEDSAMTATSPRHDVSEMDVTDPREDFNSISRGGLHPSNTDATTDNLHESTRAYNDYNISDVMEARERLQSIRNVNFPSWQPGSPLVQRESLNDLLREALSAGPISLRAFHQISQSSHPLRKSSSAKSHIRLPNIDKVVETDIFGAPEY